MITRTGWSVAAIAVTLTVVGAWAGYAELLALGGVGLIALLTAVLWTTRKYSLAVDRSLDSKRASVGGQVSNSMSVTNTGRRRAQSMMLLDRIGSTEVGSRIKSLPPSGSQVVTTAMPTSERGVLTVGPARIHRGDPLGLVRRTRSYGQTAQLRVHSQILPIALPQVGLDRSLDGEGTNEIRGDMQFDSLREYVPGDDVRRIHWRSSARSTTVLVREHVDICQPATTVVIDNRRQLWACDADFEAAVTAATSLVVAASRAGHPVMFADLGSAWAAPGSSLGEYLDFSAELKRLPADQSFEVRPSIVLQQLPMAAVSDVIVFLTGELNQAAAREVSAATRKWHNRTCAIFTSSRKSEVPPAMQTITATSAADFVRAWTAKVVIAA